MRNAILDALEARYEAQVAEADAIINIYLENSVGIGEHPQHIDEVDKQLQKIADADEKLKALEDYRLERQEI
jgi:predicted transcriptional regulator